MNPIKTHPKIAAGAAVVALVAVVAAAVVFNRGGLGSVSTSDLSSGRNCFRVGENTSRATFVYTGVVDGGSVSVGATLQAINSRTDEIIGENTARFRASGTFRHKLVVEVNYDEDEVGSADVECRFTSARDGWHLPGR